MKFKIFFSVVLLLVVTSCGNPKDFVYFQTAYPSVFNSAVEHPINTIKPSKPELAVPYNFFSVMNREELARLEGGSDVRPCGYGYVKTYVQAYGYRNNS